MKRLVISGAAELAGYFMSGYSGEVPGRHGVLGPGEHLLPKPFSLAQLLANVLAALDRDGPRTSR